MFLGIFTGINIFLLILHNHNFFAAAMVLVFHPCALPNLMDFVGTLGLLIVPDKS